MCLLELLCCCFGPSACGICCKTSGAKSSITTRIMYVVFLAFLVVICSIMLAPAVQQGLTGSIFCQLNLTTPGDIQPIPGLPPLPTVVVLQHSLPCDQIIGYLAVYRISMAVASFFFVLMLVMMCVFSSKDPRAYIQNGFWCIKWLLVIGLVVAFFFIPTSENFVFSKVCVVLGMLGGIFFIILQIIFLVDFAHVWAEKVLEKKEETESNWWYTFLLVPAVVFYLVALVGIILMFVFFTNPAGGCELNIFFLTSILVLSIAVSVVAILPWIQRAQPTSGLLQPSIVALYTTYLTWSALSNEPYGPNENCSLNNTVGNLVASNGNAIASSVVGIILMFITVAYTSIYLSSNKQIQKFRGNHKDESEGYSAVCCDCCCPSAAEVEERETETGDEAEDDEKVKRIHVHDDEKEHVTYSYSFFHFLMLISVLYIMIQLTNWTDPGSASTTHFQNTIASTWVKMASAWFCFVVYLWTLLAPLILRNRDFGYVQE